MRIVFFGTPSSCLPIVKKIYCRFDLSLMIAKSSKLALSRREQNESKLEVFSNSENINYLTPDKFDSSFIKDLSLEDGVATLTEFTAQIIISAIKNPDNYKEKIILCGGGRKNNFLVNK